MTIRKQKKASKRLYSTSFKMSGQLEIDTPSGWSQPADQLLYYRPKSTENFLSHKAVLFDMDGTIISTKSGKKFPIDENDWKFYNGAVKRKLSTLFEVSESNQYCSTTFENL